MKIQTLNPPNVQPPAVKNIQTSMLEKSVSGPVDSFSPTDKQVQGGMDITNFNQSAADQQMFLLDMRAAQSIQKDTEQLLASKDPSEVGRALTASQQRLAKMNARKGPQTVTNFAQQAVEHQVKVLTLHLKQLQAAPGAPKANPPAPHKANPPVSPNPNAPGPSPVGPNNSLPMYKSFSFAARPEPSQSGLSSTLW